MAQSQSISRSVMFSLLLLAMIGGSSAFVAPFSANIHTNTKTTTHLMASMSKNDNDPSSSARTDFLRSLGLTAAGWAVSGFQAANAAETDDTTATATAETASVTGMLQSSNLRSLKRAEKQLSKMEFYAVENDYENIKLSLRNAPFSEIRKNSFALIKEYAGQPDQQSKLTESYNVFISAVEKMDNLAGQGMRGRKFENGELLKTYQATSTALNDWIEVATAVSTESS